MTTIATCLLENNHLVKEGLKSILADTNFKVTEAPADMQDMDNMKEALSHTDLVIFGLDEDIARLENFIHAFKSAHPESKLAILGFNTEPEYITSCFAHGADGYLTKNLSPGSLLKMNKKEKQAPDNNLSAREKEILKHLALGETNKKIALAQDIAESTVKAHIKTILRKLGLTNRTQAARWAWTEGLINETTPGSNSYYKQTQSMM